MGNEKFQLNLIDGQKEITVREVNYVNELPVMPPVKIALSGTIEAPLEFLRKRGVAEGVTINGLIIEDDRMNPILASRAHVIVNREELKIELVFNESIAYMRGTVVGVLTTHPKMREFGINTGKNWEPNELGQFMKMNRAFFADKSENMKLVTDLKGFKAKLSTNIEKEKSEKGDFADNFSYTVNSNLPGMFKLNIPLFKGSKPESLEVEFYASVDGRTVKLQLFSPGACQALEEIRDNVINEQLKGIQAIAPSIVIIEQ